MVDDLPKAPLSWILNHNNPSMGSLSQIWPTSETAIFLKTLYLTDSLRLENRLLKNIKRLLGKRSLEKLSAELGSSGRVGPPVPWALLWVPDYLHADAADASANVVAGNQRLWPKVLLSTPIATSLSGRVDEHEGPGSPSSISVNDRHTKVKRSTSLFKEALEIHLALARSENDKPVGSNLDNHIDEEAYDNTGLAGVKEQSFGPDQAIKGGDWAIDNDEIEEEEDDLFASSPSPAIMDETGASHDFGACQDKPVALDSVDRVSTSMFTPAQPPETNLDMTRYDISPADRGTQVRGYNGFEAMITDDDFDFFDVDGQEPVSKNNQQAAYEEYGDLSGTDFGVNMNQAQSSQPRDLAAATTIDDVDVQTEAKLSPTPEILIDVAHALDSGEQDMASGDGPVDGSEISIQSDDDLWNDTSLLEQLGEDSCEPIVDNESLQNPPSQDTQPQLLTMPTRVSPDVDMVAPAVSARSISAPVYAVSAMPKEPDHTDYGRCMTWSVAASAERMIPAAFDEILFDRTFFTVDTRKTIDTFPHSTDGEVCLADAYGDGRVKTRRRLIELLEVEESLRRKGSLDLLPFQSQSTIGDIDISSPRSTVSHDTQNSIDSADDASDITFTAPAFGQGDCQGILKTGYYPFSDYNIFILRRDPVTLEEQDRNTLRRKLSENQVQEVDDVPLTNPLALQSQGFNQLFGMALSSACELDTFSHCLSPLRSSAQAEYNGKTWMYCHGSRQTADPGVPCADSPSETDVRVRVGLQGNVMELSSKALPRWSELDLEPVCGRQNVQISILYQYGISMSEAKAFFRGIAQAYAVG